MIPEPAPWDEKDLIGFIDPSQYIGLDDRLLVQALSTWNNQTITVSGRVLLVQGVVKPFEFTVPMGSPRALVTFPFQLAQGFLLGLEVSAAIAAQDQGWTYVKIGLTRGGGNPPMPFQPLMSGYVGNQFPFGYPRDKNQRPTDGPGAVMFYNPDNPDPGSNWEFQVPSATRIKIVAISATLTTDDTDGDRTVAFMVGGDGNTVWQLAASGTQAPSTAAQYNWGPAGVWAGSSALGFAIPLPKDLALTNGYALFATANGIGAGDQWSNISIFGLEWANFL